MTDPRNFLDEWIQLVNNGDIESLLNLYDNEAILIPTFSNGILNTPEKLRRYFEELGSREELSVSVNEKYLVVQELQSRDSPVQLVVLDGVGHYEIPRYQEHLAAAVPWIRESWGE